MGRIGFVDLKLSESGIKVSGPGDLSSRLSFPMSVYAFRSGPAGYELESSVRYSDEKAAPLPEGIADISEFYLSLPLDLLDLRIIKLPFSEKEKLKEVIPFELSGLIMDSPDKVVFDTVVLGGSDNNFDILVAYVRKEILRDVLMRLSSIGIDPRIITSVELQAVVKNTSNNITGRIEGIGELTAEDRINAAKSELMEHTVNLRTGPFAYIRDTEKLGKALKVTAVLFILLALVINSDLAFRIITAKTEASSIKREIRNMYTGLFPDEKKISDELYQMKSHIKEIHEKGDALMGVRPLNFMLDLSLKPTGGVILNEISLDKELITMKGEASSMDNIDRLKTGLSGFLNDVSVTDIKPAAENKFSFTAVAKGRN